MNDTGEGRIAGTTIAVLVRVVRRLAGDAGVERLLALAGEGRSVAEVEDSSTWSSYDAAIRLFTAGAEVTGEPDLGRLVGQEMLLQYRGTEVAALLRSLGSPGEVLRNVAQSATKFSTATRLEAVEVGPDGATVVARAVGGLTRHPIMCDYTAGVLSQAPVLFGMDPAEVGEATCQCRGDDRCTYAVRWDASSAPDADPTRRIAYLEEQLASITERFEALQATATELATADDLDQVLRAVIERAGLTVRATQYVLAVRLGPSGPVRVEHRGFERAPPDPSLVAELLADTVDGGDGSRLIVDVATARRRFGRLAALCPPGSTFLPGERRLLEAYAASAAAAIETTAALDEARRRNGTARALLQLARALSRLAQPEEMAQRIADAVPRVVGGRRAAVLLWDEEAEHLRFAGFNGLAADAVEVLRTIPVSSADTPVLGDMLVDRSPIFIDASSEDRFLRGLLDLAEVDAVAVVPIVAGERFLGVVAAEPAPSGMDDRDDLLERLDGLAAQAATALENGRLVEQLQTQSLHDPLTGLPNRRLLHDRVDRALAHDIRSGQRPVLLFVDLDHFKTVNDAYGHAAGDSVLTELAARFRQIVRRSDTVARLGGDEFAVLLEGLSDPPVDARRLVDLILDAAREPFEIGARVVRLSASVGVAAATATDDHDSLLNRADAAMYEAKADGRDAAAIG